MGNVLSGLVVLLVIGGAVVALIDLCKDGGERR